MKLDIIDHNRVLIDTSVWIKYFKDKPAECSMRVEHVLSKHDICVPRIVVAELIYGSKTERGKFPSSWTLWTRLA
jgi:predicted nucleic acid-binding protein